MPVETVVLHDFLIVLSDALPDLAARWLAATTADTVRSLAGAERRDPWTVEGLLFTSVDELGLTVPSEATERRAIAVEWVTCNWLRNRNTRKAVAVLCQLAITHPNADGLRACRRRPHRLGTV